MDSLHIYICNSIRCCVNWVTYLFVFIWVLIKGHFPVWLINFSEKTPVCSEDEQVKTKIMRHTIGPVLIARI